MQGAVTEIQYIRGYEKSRRRSKLELEIPKEHGVPKTLVDFAKNRKIDAERRARQEGDTYLEYDAVWCVFDVDDHPNVSDAKQLAHANDIKLAISNPCFELWLLLHFRECPGAQHRQKIQTMLKKCVPAYDKSVDFESYRANCRTAIDRARSLDRLAEQINEPGRNPTTTVYKLLQEIDDKSPED